MMEYDKRKRIIIISLAALWGIVLLVGAGIMISRIGKVAVTVKYAPFAATVKLNDVVVGNNGVNYITPGEYHVVVERENFGSLEQDVIVDENTEYLYGSLDPVNEDGEMYMKEHMEEYYEVQGIAGDASLKAGMEELADFPLIAKLPVKDPYYSIGYNFNDERGMNVTVEAGIAYRQLAINRLMELMSKEDFGKYDVVFYDLESPYAGKFVDNEETDPVEYIKTGFAGVGVDFTVNGGESEGEYYYAYLRYYYKEFANVIYRIVLKNTDGGWELVAEPYPVLTTANTPGVPLEIINKVNKL